MTNTKNPVPVHAVQMTSNSEARSKPVVAMLMYPGMTMLDLVGPHETLSRLMDVHLVAKTTEEMMSDSGLRFRAEESFSDSPVDVDVLFAPGGAGTFDAMKDEETIRFLESRGSGARFVTSVCSGSLLLGAAGLLNGYKATSHWAARHLLSLFDAEPTEGRVVVDRNRITGGGVTAGIDFGLTLVAQIFGVRAAQSTQLQLEYDPAPPFSSGSPRSADPELVKFIQGAVDPMNNAIATHFGTTQVR